MVPLAVVDDVPVPNGLLDVLKFAEIPVVLIAASPVADAEAVAAAVTTDPTIEIPVAGALLSILYVRALNEFHVPANFNAWTLSKLLFPAVTGDAE